MKPGVIKPTKDCEKVAALYLDDDRWSTSTTFTSHVESSQMCLK